MQELLDHLYKHGRYAKDQSEWTFGEQIVRTAIHRGLVHVRGNPDHLCVELTPRGDRVRQGLPGEAEKQTEITVGLRDAVAAYVESKQLGELEHFSIGIGGKLTIFLKS